MHIYTTSVAQHLGSPSMLTAVTVQDSVPHLTAMRRQEDGRQKQRSGAGKRGKHTHVLVGNIYVLSAPM